jgi:hypothetical protein
MGYPRKSIAVNATSEGGGGSASEDRKNAGATRADGPEIGHGNIVQDWVVMICKKIEDFWWVPCTWQSTGAVRLAPDYA